MQLHAADAATNSEQHQQPTLSAAKLAALNAVAPVAALPPSVASASVASFAFESSDSDSEAEQPPLASETFELVSLSTASVASPA